MEKAINMKQVSDIWTNSIQITSSCMALSTQLKEQERIHLAEQLRQNALNTYIYIARCFETFAELDFFKTLRTARKHILETANVVMILNKKQLLSEDVSIELFRDLCQLNQKIFELEKAMFN